MRNIICCLVAVASIVLVSCNGHQTDTKILGVWHAYKLENKNRDSNRVYTQRIIDTLGKGNSDQTNIALYHTTNVDSLRQILQIQHDEAFKLQENAVNNTIFTLKEQGVANLSFNGQLRSGTWEVINSKRLIFTNLKGDNGDTILTDILTLNDTMLKVSMTKMVDSTKMEMDTSIIFFRREH